MAVSKVVIVAPFWRHPGHVGNYRVDRFVRWLAEHGDEVVLISGDDRERTLRMSWGAEVLVRDRLGLHRDYSSSGRHTTRPPNPLRRKLAYWIFNPDPSVIWARRASSHGSVLAAAQGARWIISSSPPESVHLAAARLARRTGARLLVDMRDGWLDEPLKPVLRTSWLRRWTEGAIECRILRQAAGIMVSSREWKESLTARLPWTAGKVTVLTNGYQVGQHEMSQPLTGDRMNPGLTLLHSGRLSGSRNTSRAELLLEPLLSGIAQAGATGRIEFRGSLDPEDQAAMEAMRTRFQAARWAIETHPPIGREELLASLPAAGGLLLLCASRAAIPGKLFEYLPARRPILAVCRRDGAVWRIASSVPQMFVVDCEQPATGTAAVAAFLDAAGRAEVDAAVPVEYSEPSLRETFLSALRPSDRKSASDR